MRGAARRGFFGFITTDDEGSPIDPARGARTIARLVACTDAPRSAVPTSENAGMSFEVVAAHAAQYPLRALGPRMARGWRSTGGVLLGAFVER
jgi:hypothetical protein